jgi:hypothetical protein
MSLLMTALKSNPSPFGEVGGSNYEIGSERKSRGNEDLEKELRKKHPS